MLDENDTLDQQLKQEVKLSMAEYQQQTEALKIQIEASNQSTR